MVKFCSEIGFGTYSCAYLIYLPWEAKFEWEDDSERELKLVAIDKCLLPEIIGLWERGIKTHGYCCGHGNKDMAFIGVQEPYIEQMLSMGYRKWFNKHNPRVEDHFVPRTQIEYGKAK